MKRFCLKLWHKIIPHVAKLEQIFHVVEVNRFIFVLGQIAPVVPDLVAVAGRQIHKWRIQIFSQYLGEKNNKNKK